MDYASARLNMVESQIRTNKVTDPTVVDAMAAVPRELYVPKALRGVAYVDEDLHLGNDRYLTEPMVIARLLQMAEIEPSDLVLIIGAATGYSCAVVARLAQAVVGLECDEVLVAAASKTLSEQGVDNAAVIQGALAEGVAKQAPFNVIIIEGAVDEVPQALFDQLADGGRLVAVVRDNGVGRATFHEKVHGATGHRTQFDANTPPLPGFQKKPGFVF